MAVKISLPNMYFFIFDFYLTEGANDDNDVVPDAILYYYPNDKPMTGEQMNECGYISGIVQYFQHDLFHSIPKTFYFRKNLIVHKHFGRHSGFLSVPFERYTEEEAHIHLNHILDLFNMVYGTWNQIYSIQDQNPLIKEYLKIAMTPIAEYICKETRSIQQVFSSIDYSPLKLGNQRVLLQSKHLLDYVISKFGLYDGLIKYDNKLLYSTWDNETTFYIQTILQMRKQLPNDLLHIPGISPSKLKNGVSLYHIYMNQSTTSRTFSKTQSSQAHTIAEQRTINFPSMPSTARSTMLFESDNISSLYSYTSETFMNSPSANSSVYSPLFSNKKRMGILIDDGKLDSAEETPVETDTCDESPSTDANEAFQSSTEFSTIRVETMSPDPELFLLKTPDIENSLTDEQKLQLTQINQAEFEETIKRECEPSIEKNCDQIRLTEVQRLNSEIDSMGGEDFGDDSHPFMLPTNTVRPRTATLTSISLTSDQGQQSMPSWTNMSSVNNEHERTQLVLLIQQNSRMTFVGLMPRDLIADDSLKNLWHCLLPQMANMEIEIQTICNENEPLKPSPNSKFQFNEATHQAEFERVSDGKGHYLKAPLEESIYLTALAHCKLQQNSDRRVIGLSRGNHMVTVDRYSPNRMNFSCRFLQDVA